MTQLPEPADLRPLTTLRFFAAAWVALYAFWPHLDVAFVPNVVAKGYLGVELFFVLSGFILSHVYLEAFGQGRFRYRGFLWARIARIYPLHLATLAGVGALGLAAVAVGMSIDANILSWPSLPANLLMLHAWGLAPQAGWNHSSWSISAEWFAYLAFPAFAFVAWKLRDRPALALAGAILLMAALYVGFERVAGFALTEATIKWGALRIVPCFAYGCALYLVHRRVGISGAGLWAMACVVAMAAAASLGAPDGVVVLFGGGLILSLGALGNGGWMGSKLGVWLGEISFAVYMVLVPWQLLAVNLAAKLTGAEDKRLQLFVWLAVVAMLPVVAAIAHHGVEKPARRLLRGWADRRTASAEARSGLTRFA